MIRPFHSFIWGNYESCSRLRYSYFAAMLLTQPDRKVIVNPGLKKLWLTISAGRQLYKRRPLRGEKMLSFIKHNLHMLTVFQAIIFMVLLTLTPFRKNKANRYLFFFLFFIMCSEMGGFLNHLTVVRYAISRAMPTLFFLGTPLSFLAYPFLYLYIRALTNGERRLKIIDALHSIPFLAVFTYVIIEYFSKGMDTVRFIATTNYNLFTYHEYENMRIIRVLQIYFYIVLSFIDLLRYRRTLTDLFSSTSKISLNWIRFFLGAIAIWGVFETGSLFVYVNNYYLYPYAYILSSLIFLTIITGLFLRSLCQQEIILPPADPDTKKYKKNQLDEMDKERYLRLLKDFMQQNKPYLEPEITVKDLSQMTNIPSHCISQVLNTSLNQNFYDFINHYRIMESCRLLEENSRPRSIIEVVYESGFNSKSTFNAAFKKHTGITPSQFKNKKAGSKAIA